MKRKLVYVCLLAMVAGGMMSFSYDIPEKQETGGREDRVISFPGAEGHGRYTTGGRGMNRERSSHHCRTDFSRRNLSG